MDAKLFIHSQLNLCVESFSKSFPGNAFEFKMRNTYRHYLLETIKCSAKCFVKFASHIQKVFSRIQMYIPFIIACLSYETIHFKKINHCIHIILVWKALKAVDRESETFQLESCHFGSFSKKHVNSTITVYIKNE